MNEQRTRFRAWWHEYLNTAMRVSTGGNLWSLADTSEEIAWKAWQAAKSDKPAPQNTMAQSIAAQIEGGGWPRTD